MLLRPAPRRSWNDPYQPALFGAHSYSLKMLISRSEANSLAVIADWVSVSLCSFANSLKQLGVEGIIFPPPRQSGKEAESCACTRTKRDKKSPTFPQQTNKMPHGCNNRWRPGCEQAPFGLSVPWSCYYLCQCYIQTLHACLSGLPISQLEISEISSRSRSQITVSELDLDLDSARLNWDYFRCDSDREICCNAILKSTKWHPSHWMKTLLWAPHALAVPRIETTVFVVVDQQQRAPFPWSELSHRLLLKLHNSSWFLGRFIYILMSVSNGCAQTTIKMSCLNTY